MLSFDQALTLTLQEARPLGVQSVPLEHASDRVLAEAVVADFDFPASPTSAMDGYALAGHYLDGRTRFEVVGESFPGAPFRGVPGPGQCVRIFTGAALPQGADRVVIQEMVRRDGDVAEILGPLGGVSYVRSAGSDFRRDDVLLPAGLPLTPQRLVAAGAADVAEVRVWRKPRITLLANGDELAAPGQARERPNAIPESVSLGVAALARRYGGEVIAIRRLPDDLGVLKAAAADAVQASDLVVVTGGASVGEKDYAQRMFEGAGLALIFAKAAIKPGKPVWLGRCGGALVLGLPGNPSSALVTARLFLAPLVTRLAGGQAEGALQWREERLSGALPATDDRETFYRARRGPEGLEPLSDQASGAQRALALADMLIRRAPGAPAAGAGERIQAVKL